MKTLAISAVLFGLPWLFACSDDDRPGPCVGCVEQTGGFGATVGSGGSGAGGAGGSALASSGGAPQCGDVRGAPMVFVEAPQGGGYCIDVREVSVTEWNVFRNLPGNDTPKQPTPCDGNSQWTDIGGDSELPASNVDWCDASAFCQWAGKRLCGKIGGGDVISIAEATDPTASEWFRACSNAGSSAFPYGDAFSDAACNTNTDASAALEAVQSNPDCHGPVEPFASIFDMSGNVGEWTSLCISDGVTVPSDEPCYLQGGDYMVPTPDENTQCLSLVAKDRLEPPAPTMGIRCCKDADVSDAD